jgi:hypothetical protein
VSCRPRCISYSSSASCRLAVALPVTLFLQNAFAIANDSEAPEVRGSTHLHACCGARQPADAKRVRVAELARMDGL